MCFTFKWFTISLQDTFILLYFTYNIARFAYNLNSRQGNVNLLQT